MPALRFVVQKGAAIVSTERVNPSSKGWGVAALIIALAIVANVTAYSIHKATYLKPDKAAAHGARPLSDGPAAADERDVVDTPRLRVRGQLLGDVRRWTASLMLFFVAGTGSASTSAP